MSAFRPPSLEAFAREVGASAEEFARSIHAAHPGAVDTIAPNTYRLVDGDVVLEVTAQPLPLRKLGQFALPVLDVRFRFVSGDDAGRAALIARLDRAMQRGGG